MNFQRAARWLFAARLIVIDRVVRFTLVGFRPHTVVHRTTVYCVLCTVWCVLCTAAVCTWNMVMTRLPALLFRLLWIESVVTCTAHAFCSVGGWKVRAVCWPNRRAPVVNPNTRTLQALLLWCHCSVSSSILFRWQSSVNWTDGLFTLLESIGVFWYGWRFFQFPRIVCQM